MPTIFEEDGYRFFFYSNEHLPVHAHVRYGGGEAAFEIGDFVELRDSQNMKLNELKKAQKLAIAHRELILEKWHDFIG